LKDDFNKDKYLKIISQDNVENYYIKNKICAIRPGLYRINYNYKYINMSKCNIVTFLQTEKVDTFNIDAIDIIKQYKNHESNIIFLDPPYLNSCNSFYNNPNTNVYKYIQDNDLKNNEAFFCIVLEKNKIIDLLFEKYYKIEYEKEYEPKHNKTTHLMILNNIDNI
jgi:16S rRNA G966 N2-methylase RsmD